MKTQPPAVAGPCSPAAMYDRIEAMNLAYSYVHRSVADPKTYDAPIAGLISKAYAAKRAALINPNRANCEVEAGDPVGSNTTYLTIIAKNGNITSWIQSVYGFFGSRVTVEGMGFQLQNRGAAFTLQHIGLGIMGGAVQPLAHAPFVSNIVDYGMNIQEAMEAPRFAKNSADGSAIPEPIHL